MFNSDINWLQLLKMKLIAKDFGEMVILYGVKRFLSPKII